MQLASENLDVVLNAAWDLLQAKRQPAPLVENLRRCLAGSPVQALRAALTYTGSKSPFPMPSLYHRSVHVSWTPEPLGQC